jgi:hypothetical protein
MISAALAMSLLASGLGWAQGYDRTLTPMSSPTRINTPGATAVAAPEEPPPIQPQLDQLKDQIQQLTTSVANLSNQISQVATAQSQEGQQLSQFSQSITQLTQQNTQLSEMLDQLSAAQQQMFKLSQLETDQLTAQIELVSAAQQEMMVNSQSMMRDARQRLARLHLETEAHWLENRVALEGLQEGINREQSEIQQLICKPGFSDWLRQYSRATLAGTFGRRHMLEKFYITPPATGRRSDGSPIPAPTSATAHSYWGEAFFEYELLAPCALYTALRGTWGTGHLHSHPTNAIYAGANDLFTTSSHNFSHIAHEWDVEARLGWTWSLTRNTMVALFTGAGYHGIDFNMIGRSKAIWWRVPVGFHWEWEPSCMFRMGVDGMAGLMANGRFFAWDEPFAAGGYLPRPFDNRYQWEVEMPFSFGDTFRFEIVPFWNGWKTREKVIGQGIIVEPANDEGLISAGSTFALAAPDLESSLLGGRVAMTWKF